VLATLIYLSRQIRENSKLLSTSIHESAMAGYNEINFQITSDPHVAELAMTLLIEPDKELTTIEKFQASTFIRTYCNHVYKLFRLYELKILPEKEWLNAAAEAKQVMYGTSAGRDFVSSNHYFDDLWVVLEKIEKRDITNHIGQ